MNEQAEIDFTGEELKENGQKKVLRSISEEYREQFIQAVKTLATEQFYPFSSDVVIRAIGFPEGCSKNAIGALMNKFAKEGLIEPYGFTKGTRPSQHGHMIRTWVGKK